MCGTKPKAPRTLAGVELERPHPCVRDCSALAEGEQMRKRARCESAPACVEQVSLLIRDRECNSTTPAELFLRTCSMVQLGEVAEH